MKARRQRVAGWCAAALVVTVAAWPQPGWLQGQPPGKREVSRPAAVLTRPMPDNDGELVQQRGLYDQLDDLLPTDLRQLGEVALEHEVPVKEALSEFDMFSDVVKREEGSNVPWSAQPSTACTSRMFAPWSRLAIGGGESPQEMDTKQSPVAGPAGEVLLHNGELRLEQVDYRLPSRAGLGLSFARTYRGHVDYDGPLGPGWDHNHNQRLVVNGAAIRLASRIAWYNGHRRIVFVRSGKSWQAEAGAFYRLTLRSATILIETPTLDQFVFEPATSKAEGRQLWRIRTIATRHGRGQVNTLSYRYAAESDRLAKIEDPYENPVRLEHDDRGRLVELRRGSTVIRYEYNALGCLSAVVTISVARAVTESADVITRFDYARPAKGRPWLKAVVPPGARRTLACEYEFEPNSEDFGRVRSLCMGSGATLARWEFSRKRDALKEDYTVTIVKPKPLPAEYYVFSTQGEQPQVLPEARTIPSWEATWKLVYNRDGLLAEEQMPLGGVRRWEYDTGNAEPLFRGNLLVYRELARPGPNPLEIGELGTAWKYDEQIALPVEETAYEITTEGQRRELLVTRHQYGGKDRELLGRSVGGQKETYVRNRFGLVVAEFDGLGAATVRRYYNRFNKGSSQVNGGGLLAEVVRDADPDQVVRELDYRLIREELPRPKRTVVARPVAQSTKYAYDRRGHRIREKRDGYEQRWIYSKLGMPLAHYDSRTDLTLYEYDKALAKSAEFIRVASLPEAKYKGVQKPGVKGQFYVQRFDYDALGKLASWVPSEEFFNADGEAAAVRFAWYPAGLLKSRATAGKITAEMVYDERTGRLQKKTLVAQGDTTERLVLQAKMSYDKEGFRKSYVDDRKRKYLFTADPFGRPFARQGPDKVEEQSHVDGLGRTVCTRTVDAALPGRDWLVEAKFDYDAAGNLLKRQVHRRWRPSSDGEKAVLDEWFVEGEFKYDAAGRCIRERSFRNGSFTSRRYDGLGRRICTEGPEGDRESILYDGDEPVLKTNELYNPVKLARETIRWASLLDARRRPWLTVPIDRDGNPVFDRAVVRVHDTQGRLIREAKPGRTRLVTVFDSLGRVNTRREDPLPPKPGQTVKVVRSDYDLDGRLLCETVENRPMVFAQVGKERAGRAGGRPGLYRCGRVYVPQVTTYEYDSFGRLERQVFPDGLVKKHKYGEDLMIASITWTHEEAPEFMETIGLAYDEVRRLVQVKDGKSGDPIQDFKFDRLGNLVEGIDRGNRKHPVKLTRRWDNLGNLLKESVSTSDGPAPVWITCCDDLREGKRTTRVEGIKGQRGGIWQEMTLRTDLAGRPVAIDVDGEFCTYSYVGQQMIQKSLPAAGIDLAIETSTLGEPIGYTYTDTVVGKRLCQLDYLLDGQGTVIASTCKLRSAGNQQPRGYARSQFYQHDCYSALAAEGGQAAVFPNTAIERKAVLKGSNSLEAYRARRYLYDEAGNLIVKYRGIAKKISTDILTPVEEQMAAGYRIFSPGKPLQLAALPGTEEARAHFRQKAAQKRDLASNRLTSMLNPGGVADFEYDRRGRLTKFSSYSLGRQLDWKLDYDLLGRVTRMEGLVPGGKSPVMLLELASDVLNRRVLKRVYDLENQSRTVFVTTYLGRNPIVVMENGGNPDSVWSLSAEYLWGPGTREVIMAVLPVRKVESQPSHDWARYFLHQDRMLNVFLCTRGEEEQVQVFDIASYWGFGENSTTGVINGVNCSEELERGSNTKLAYDQQLDEKCASWLGGGECGWLALELENPSKVTQLTIWSDKFPKSFRVYALPPAGAVPSRDRILTWEEEHALHKVAEVNEGVYGDGSWKRRKLLDDVRDPYEIPLTQQKKETRTLVLVWEGGKPFSVREFELTVQPNNPGSLAFSGCWLDQETGLYCHGSRYRLPSLGGRFTSPDPLGFLDGYNLYAYAYNDPLTWHDPDGEFAHILIGAGTGAALGGGGYMFQVWWTGEEFSWAKLGVYTGAGAVSGAVGAATLGTSTAWQAIALGGAQGAAKGAITGGGITYLETGEIGASLKAGVEQATLGAIGGAFRGAVLGKIGANFGGNVMARIAEQSAKGGVRGGLRGYTRTGTLSGTLEEAAAGALRGAAVGSVVGAAEWGLGRVAQGIRPSLGQLGGEPVPRPQGLLIRTSPVGNEYGETGLHSGHARPQVKSLNLNGTHTPRNIQMPSWGMHRQAHPGGDVTNTPIGTIFY